jgi:hypothetical protein
MTNDEVRGRFQGDDVEFHIADDVLVLSRNAVLLSQDAVAASTVLQSMLSTSGDRDQAEVHLSHEQSEHCRWWIAARARREGCADYILGPSQIGSGGEDNIACMIRVSPSCCPRILSTLVATVHIVESLCEQHFHLFVG